MQFPDISDGSEWLRDKPYSWRYAIAARMALRLLPMALNWSRYDPDEAKPRIAGMLFLSSCNIHATLNPQIAGFAESMASSLGIVLHPDLIDGGACGAAMISQRVIYNVGKTSWDMRQVEGQQFSESLIESVYDEGIKAIDEAYPSGVLLNTRSWFDTAINDLSWTARHVHDPVGPWKLVNLPLWQGKLPTWVKSEINAAKGFQTELGSAFALWFDWYERRIVGQDRAFQLSENQNCELYKFIADNNISWNSNIEHSILEISVWMDQFKNDQIASSFETKNNVPSVDFEQLLYHVNELKEFGETISSEKGLIGHNNPPEGCAIDLDGELREDIAKATDELELEISVEAPEKSANPERLKRILKLLESVQRRVLSLIDSAMEAIRKEAAQLAQKARDMAREQLIKTVVSGLVVGAAALAGIQGEVVKWFFALF